MTASNTFKAHGLTWTTDTMDWPNEQASEIASSALEDAVKSWEPELAARIHALLLNDEEEGGTFINGDMEDTLIEYRTLTEAQSMAFEAATEGWARQPQSGCNCQINAEA